jgi:FkbM family methyltransferase
MKFRFLLGRTARVQIHDDWVVTCHPICVPEFSIFVTDVEQRDEMHSFIKLCEPGMQFLDVGAHWGIFTLAAIHHGGSGARCVAIEPSPSAAQVLRQNLEANKVQDRAEVIQAAAGAKAGTVSMLTTGAGGADYFVVPSEKRPDTIHVPQIELTGLCRDRGFKPTHIKIDVEGFEEEVLSGARGLLEKLRPILFLELHGDLIRARGKRPENVLQILAQIGYSPRGKPDERTAACDFNANGFNARVIYYPDLCRRV